VIRQAEYWNYQLWKIYSSWVLVVTHGSTILGQSPSFQAPYLVREKVFEVLQEWVSQYSL